MHCLQWRMPSNHHILYSNISRSRQEGVLSEGDTARGGWAMPQNPIDLTGQWEGHYQQHDVKYPIRATLEQHGDRLTGTMQDGVTEFTRSVFDAALLAGLPPGADEQIE